MSKSAEAFRTISEVADELEVPKHVLRFWEQRFPQIKPMKRGGGRRYYRPEDLELLRGIRRLLHAEGYTIKGVQKILREQGVDAVKAAGIIPAGAPISDAPHVLAAGKKTHAVSKRPARAEAHKLDGEAGPAKSARGRTKASSGKAGSRGRTKASAGTSTAGAPDAAQLVSGAIAELEEIRKILMATAPAAKAARRSTAKRPAAKRARTGGGRA